MRALSSFFYCAFDGDYAIERYLAYTTDHLGRMIANNPNGALDAAIAATTVALGAVEDA